jgi:UDP-N-acetylmuramyl pentapeptide phosphotransferase/UDP-N-acetylglucosamine-1-phosphate transferase
MMIQIVLWGAVALFGFLWWNRHNANKKARKSS